MTNVLDQPHQCQCHTHRPHILVHLLLTRVVKRELRDDPTPRVRHEHQLIHPVVGEQVRVPAQPVEAQDLSLTRAGNSTVTYLVLEDTGVPVFTDPTLSRIYRQGEVLDIVSVDELIIGNRIPVLLDRELLVRILGIHELSHRCLRSRYTAQAPRAKASKSPNSPTAAFASSARPSKYPQSTHSFQSSAWASLNDSNCTHL